jgi:phosphohistidine phosphatase
LRLILVQHGDAVNKEQNPERPLSEAGRRDITALASFLADRGLGATRVLHSGKLRAHESAEILAARFAPAAVETAAGLAPKDPVEPWRETVETLSGDTLIVGHQPFLGTLAAALLGATDLSVIGFRPGTALCLERAGEWRWSLTWMLPPPLLQQAE